MGEIYTGDVSVLEDDSLSWSNELTLGGPHLEEAPFEEFCGDVMMGIDTPSIEHTDLICNEPPDVTLVSSPLLPTVPSHLHAYHESLGDIRGYNPSFDPSCAYVEDKPQKIMWNTFFDHTFDFSRAFYEFKRPITLFAPSFLMFSYSHHSEMHATTYDKLLGALTAFEWSPLILDARSG